jgi:hypothetical protein
MLTYIFNYNHLCLQTLSVFVLFCFVFLFVFFCVLFIHAKQKSVFVFINKNHYFFQILLTLFVENKTVILFSSLRIIHFFLKKYNNRIEIKLSITCDGFGGLLLGFPIYSIKQNLILHDQKPNTFVLESSVDFISKQMY